MADKTSVAKGRREVLRKAVYLAPLIVTLPVLPSFASAGSRSSVRGRTNKSRPGRRRNRG